MSEAEAEIAKISEDVEKWKEAAKRAAYALHLERKISGHPMADEIREAIGDPSRFESLEDLEISLEKVRSKFDDLAEKMEEARRQEEREKIEAEIEKVEREKEEVEERARALEDSVRSLREKLRRALEVGEDMDRRISDLESRLEEAEEAARKAEIGRLKAEAVFGYTNAHQLLEMLEGVDSPQAIRKIVSRHGRKDLSDKHLQQLRESVARGKVLDAQDMQMPRKRLAFDGPQVLGEMTVEEFRQLAGLDDEIP